MKSIKWLEGNRIQIDPPKKTKKITGTRFATVLGLNPWATEFEIWCAVTKTYEIPYEDTIYTIAGKTIEPKQADYLDLDELTPSVLNDMVKAVYVHAPDKFNVHRE